jgi:hypothetical protein
MVNVTVPNKKNAIKMRCSPYPTVSSWGSNLKALMRERYSMTVHSLWFERESPVVSKGMDLIVIPLSVKQSMDVALQSHDHLQLNYQSYCDFVLAMVKVNQPL